MSLMSTWLKMFQTTITCPSCREHFGETLTGYRQRFPDYLSSRTKFMMFTFRAHNAVNNRLHKPIYATVHDCFEVLRNNVKGRTARDYRTAYLNHIRRFWKTLQDTSGITSLKKIIEMSKIEVSYFQSRENNFEITIPEDSTFLAPAAMTLVQEDVNPSRSIDPRNAPRIGFIGGRLRIR